MNVYMVTDDSGYSCYLIGIFSTMEKAKAERLGYIAEDNRQSYLDRTLQNHVKTITANLDRNFYRDGSWAKKTLAMSDEERAYWWMECHYKIKEIELDTVVDIMLYAE